MRTKQLSACLLAALAVIISCGSTSKTVQYVYVDQPVYDPAPEVTISSRPQKEYVDNTEALSRARSNEAYNGNTFNRTEKVYNSNDSATGSQQKKSAYVLGNTYVAGVFRGVGIGESTSATAAYKMATTRAAKDALDKVTLVIDAIDSDTVESVNTAGMESFKSTTKAQVRAVLRNIKVVYSERTKGPQTWVVEHCVEISANDVIESIAPILEKLNAADRRRVEEAIRKGSEESMQ